MNYTSAADNAKSIREALKKHYGLTSRQVSIRSKSFSMGSSIHVEIHDCDVDIKEVENAARKFEQIDRCPVTHEILSGSNRYLSIGYSDKAAEALAIKKAELIELLLSDMPKPNTTTSGTIRTDTDGTQYALSYDGWQLHLGWKPAGSAYINSRRAYVNASNTNSVDVAAAMLNLRKRN